MKDTKERILLEALELFAKNGYEAVSVSDIAHGLGVTKGALYRHYRSKRDIFESILRRMERRDAEQAEEHDLPTESRGQMEEAYRSASVDDMVDFAEAMFRYWTQDAFAAPFRRMLTLEQFRDSEMQKLFQQYLGVGPMEYMRDLLAAQGLPRPRETAARFYGQLFFLFGVYDAAEDRQAVAELCDALLEDERKRLKSEGRA